MALYEQVRRDIVSGEFRPQEKMRMAMLMARYAVGASPLREALSRLAGEGFLTQFDQRGFMVPAVSIPELRELTRTRCLLHETLVRESLALGDEAWEDQLVLDAHHLDATRRAGRPQVLDPDWERLHRAFHLQLIAGCGLRPMIDFYAQLYDNVDRYRYVWAQSGVPSRDVNAEHKAIVDAAIARDTARTIALLDTHICTTADAIERYAASRG
jgi:GntR family carbon starvation induced transcriptional regulator